jgi:hypothetical protein
MTTTTEPTYSAHVGVNEDGDAIDLVVRKRVPAGIDGPHGGADKVESLTEVERWLVAHSYQRVSNWRFVKAYDGLRLEADLAYAPVRPDWIYGGEKR